MSGLSYLDQSIQQMIRATHVNYSEDSISQYLDQYTFEDLHHIKNKWDELIKCTLVKHQLNQVGETNAANFNNKCVVYLHGYGSIRLESLYILKYLPKEYCLCMFDMSGSGRSQGQFITYGIKESQDIEPVISFLNKKKKIQQFVLWGRSMGAVASLFYTIQRYTSQSQSGTPNTSNIYSKRTQEIAPSGCAEQNSLVSTVVLDSAFHNFKDVAKELAVNRMSIPTFLVNVAINYVDQIFAKLMQNSIGSQYNPFNINFDHQINLSIPILVVYSKKDEVVAPFHSERIIKNIRSKFQKIISDEYNHNEARPAQIVNTIFQKLIKYNRLNHKFQEKRLKSSFMSRDSQSNYCRRGIFVFTPSKEKEQRSNSVNSFNNTINSVRSIAYKHQQKLKYSSIKLGNNIKSSKAKFYNEKTAGKKPERQQKQIIINEPVYTQANGLINRKLFGIKQTGTSSIRMLRSKRCNLQMKRQEKLKKCRYFQ